MTECEDEMDKILIGIPTTGYIPATFIRCLLDLTGYLTREGIRHEIMLEEGTIIHMSRDRIANRAINENFTHVLWIDSDMKFTEEILETLMFHKKEMVCSVFQSRRPPFNSCIFSEIDEGRITRYEQYPDRLFKIEGCGFGCVLTETQLLKTVHDNFQTCFWPMTHFGEDLSFCKRVRLLKREIWCDPSARVGHIAHVPVYPEDHEAAMRAREEQRC